MTGAMCVVAQGSAIQLAVATIVMLLYMLLVLKTAPFEEDSEDWSSFIGCFALCLTSFCGLCLIMDDPLDPAFDSNVMMVILITLNALAMMIQIGIVVLLDGGVWDRCCMKRKQKVDRSHGGRRKSTQIVPQEIKNMVNSWDVSETNVMVPPPPPKKNSTESLVRVGPISAENTLTEEENTRAMADWDATEPVGSKLRFEVSTIPGSKTEICTVQFDKGKLGLDLDLDSDGFSGAMISSVAKGGQADMTGNVHVGDLLLEVNGNPVADKQFNEVMDTIKSVGRPLIFKLQKRTEDFLQYSHYETQNKIKM